MRQLDRVLASPTSVGVVLGLGQNGMATARALGRAGIPVVGLDSDLVQPGARTRYAVPVACPDFGDSSALVERLVALGRRLAAPGVLFPSGDLNLAAISEHREILAPYYRMALPPKDVVRMVLNKKLFYQFAMEHGFPIPQTIFPDGPEDIERAAGQLRYPCLIKPFQPTAAWRKSFETRLFVADSAAMLRALYGRIARVHRDLIVQEYMVGRDSDLSFGFTYLDAAGKPLGVFTGRKLRQYPRRFGSSTFAESRWDPWVVRETTDILQAMGHRGYGTVEFKRDRRDGHCKITEVTAGRTWFPHSLVTRAGLNLPLIWYRDVLGLDTEVPASFVEGLKWIHEERDLKTVLLYFLPEGELSLGSWLRSYRGKRVYAYAAWDDPGPILAASRRVARAAWRRAWRRLLPGHRAPLARQQGQSDDLLRAADPVVGRVLRQADIPETH